MKPAVEQAARLPVPRSAAGAALGRRAVLQSAVLAAALRATPTLPAHAAGSLPAAALPADIGDVWRPIAEFPVSAVEFPEPFTLYLSRFLLNYDGRSAEWYGSVGQALPAWWAERERNDALADQVATFGASLRYRLVAYATPDGTQELWRALASAYGTQPGALDQLPLLFSLLPPAQQPVAMMRDALSGRPQSPDTAAATYAAVAAVAATTPGAAPAAAAPVGAAAARARPALGTFGSPSAALPLSEAQASELLRNAPASLLPSSTRPAWDSAGAGFRLPGALGEEGAMARSLGRLGRAPLTKEVALTQAIYAGFMLSGGAGCAITHLAVVPLDVVKTRIQTRPNAYSGFADALATIRREEGLPMLFQGAGATGAGYFAYGVCVYPLYEYFKRFFFSAAGAQLVLGARVPLVLLAGATATVFTCFAITPFEAVRIRMVECPAYAPDLRTALTRYVREGGLLSLYDGLIPLLVRQVLFGMVKFLVFDTCADAIKGALPAAMAEQLSVALAVSLLSGAIAGVFASVVSQPADVVLSRVAQGEGSSQTVGKLPGQVNQLALLQQAATQINTNYGPAGFFRGLPSRCLWSGAIIAGQFFLYDLFKEALHLTAQDLSLFYDAWGASAAATALSSASTGL